MTTLLLSPASAGFVSSGAMPHPVLIVLLLGILLLKDLIGPRGARNARTTARALNITLGALGALFALNLV